MAYISRYSPNDLVRIDNLRKIVRVVSHDELVIEGRALALLYKSQVNVEHSVDEALARRGFTFHMSELLMKSGKDHVIRL